MLWEEVSATEPLLRSTGNKCLDTTRIPVVYTDRVEFRIEAKFDVDFGPAADEDSRSLAFFRCEKKLAKKPSSLNLADLVDPVDYDVNRADAAEEPLEQLGRHSQIVAQVFPSGLAEQGLQTMIVKGKLENQ